MNTFARQEQMYAKRMKFAHPEILKLENHLAAMTDAQIKQMIQSLSNKRSTNHSESIRVIGTIVAGYYGYTWDDMISPHREHHKANVRMLAMYLARDITKRSLPDVGRKFCRDHTTVVNATTVIARRAAKDPELAEDILILRECIASQFKPREAA